MHTYIYIITYGITYTYMLGVLFLVNLAQLVIWEEVATTVTMFPSDRPVDMCEGHFFNN